MEFGIVGLGRMGGNMARRFARKGMKIAVMNRTFDVTEVLVKETGRLACVDYTSLVTALEAPRIVWLMLPYGEVTKTVLSALLPLLSSGDLIVDSSNGHYKDDRPRAVRCAQFSIKYVDAGVSGGVWGLENGYCIMFGGSDAAAGHLQPHIQALAPTSVMKLALAMHFATQGKNDYVAKLLAKMRQGSGGHAIKED